MKNISLILNGVLAVAVAVLYYLHFSTCGVPSTSKVADSLSVVEGANLSADSALSLMPDSLPAGGTIAFVDFDDLTKRYKFYSDGVKMLEVDFKKKQEELVSMQKKFEDLNQTLSNLLTELEGLIEKSLILLKVCLDKSGDEVTTHFYFSP